MLGSGRPRDNCSVSHNGVSWSLLLSPKGPQSHVLFRQTAKMFLRGWSSNMWPEKSITGGEWLKNMSHIHRISSQTMTSDTDKGPHRMQLCRTQTCAYKIKFNCPSVGFFTWTVESEIQSEGIWSQIRLLVDIWVHKMCLMTLSI